MATEYILFSFLKNPKQKKNQNRQIRKLARQLICYIFQFPSLEVKKGSIHCDVTRQEFLLTFKVVGDIQGVSLKNRNQLLPYKNSRHRSFS